MQIRFVSVWMRACPLLTLLTACGAPAAEAPASTPRAAGTPARVASAGIAAPVPIAPPTGLAGAPAANSGGSAIAPPAAPVAPAPIQPPAAAGTPTLLPLAGAPSAPTAPVTGTAAPALTPASLFDPATGVLNAPAPGDGVQITTMPFDLAPGQEKFSCFHTEIPIDGEINVHYYESKMAAGSHHFILYKENDAGRVGQTDQTGCLPAFQNWIYSSAQPHMDLRMPEGVAMALNSRQKVVFDLHYINTGDQAIHAVVSLNVVLAKGKFEKAASLISFNTQIRIPARGAQTVGGDCTPGAGAKFFYMLTHTHRRGKLATITRVLANGMMGEELVRSTDWEVPMERKWIAEPLLTFQAGEKFHYSCEYQNDLNQVVTAGASAATNEMCMAITYYYPGSAGGSCF